MDDCENRQLLMSVQRKMCLQFLYGNPLRTFQSLISSLLVSPAQKWSTRTSGYMASFLAICPNSWILLTHKTWGLDFVLRALEGGKELRHQWQFKGRDCEIQKVSGKSSRDHCCYGRRKRLKLFMKVPGENNMRKLTRFNAYGEEKRK